MEHHNRPDDRPPTRSPTPRNIASTLLCIFIAVWPMAILTWHFNGFDARSWVSGSPTVAPSYQPAPAPGEPVNPVSAAPVSFNPGPAPADPEPPSPAIPDTRASDEAYRQLVANCQYWTEQVRAGTAMPATQNVACDRMRQYAANHGLASPRIPNYRASKRQPRRVSASASAEAKRAQERIASRCRDIDQKISSIRAEMRAGYRVARGERLKQDLRRLTTQQRKKCTHVRR